MLSQLSLKFALASLPLRQENWSGVEDVQHPPPPTHNHPFLLAHTIWVWEVLLGISLVSPREFNIRPPLLTDMPSMAGSLLSGAVSVSWAWSGGPAASGAFLNVSAAINTVVHASVPIPGFGASARVYEGGVLLWDGVYHPGIEGVRGAALSGDGNYLVVETGSGSYAFVVHQL